MKNSVTLRINKVVEINKNKLEVEITTKYNEAISIYENLVQKGLAVKRGNNLKSLDQISNRTTFNNVI
ncbi:MAG: hypothetical protein RLZZ312_133 [Bacteroidota bacterium]|jgi:hypothetical protein